MRTYLQTPELEITLFFEHFLSYFRRNKIKCILFYLIYILYFSLPSFQIPVLGYSGFRITSLMEQRALENSMLFYPEQSWVSISDVSPYLLKSVIAMEDGKFFSHKGIDWEELNKSLKANIRYRRSARGASTITMQLAKNLYLTTDKSLLRKAKELLITFRMEKELSKKSILQNYINAVEWGNGIFGIKKASQIYFDKEPDKLNRNESSRLAAVIPSPLKYKPDINSAYVLRRASIIRARIDDVVLFPQK